MLLGQFRLPIYHCQYHKFTSIFTTFCWTYILNYALKEYKYEKKVLCVTTRRIVFSGKVIFELNYRCTAHLYLLTGQNKDKRLFKVLTALPQKFRSPRNEPLDPVNENIGSGTGIGTFTPTCESYQYEHWLYMCK